MVGTDWRACSANCSWFPPLFLVLLIEHGGQHAVLAVFLNQLFDPRRTETGTPQLFRHVEYSFAVSHKSVDDAGPFQTERNGARNAVVQVVMLGRNCGLDWGLRLARRTVGAAPTIDSHKVLDFFTHPFSPLCCELP